jgi:hypothetical protein
MGCMGILFRYSNLQLWDLAGDRHHLIAILEDEAPDIRVKASLRCAPAVRGLDTEAVAPDHSWVWRKGGAVLREGPG